MLNVIAIQGRITHSLELKTSTGGKDITSFSIAVDRGFGENKTTDFFDCIAWGWTAKFITSYFTKGQMILLTGRLETNEYTDRNGNARKAFRINVDKADFAGGKAESMSAAESDPTQEEVSDVGSIIDDEDLPF